MRGRCYVPEGLFAEPEALKGYQLCFLTNQNALITGAPKLINGQSVFNDICENRPIIDQEIWRKVLDYHLIPRPLPPFPLVWIEAKTIAYKHFGIMVKRWPFMEYQQSPHWSTLATTPWGCAGRTISIKDAMLADKPKWVIEAPVFVDVDGSAFIHSTIFYWLDDGGSFLCSARLNIRDETIPNDCSPSADILAARRNSTAVSRLHTCFLLSVFGRLNCHNVRLEPINITKPRKHRMRSQPTTIWHEIRVSSVPGVASSVRTGHNDANHTDLRFHWVRGHYADYSRGNGMFGNPDLKKVFWIPEHPRGAIDNGEVISSYVVA
jgi:hypothetical protein